MIKHLGLIRAGWAALRAFVRLAFVPFLNAHLATNLASLGLLASNAWLASLARCELPQFCVPRHVSSDTQQLFVHLYNIVSVTNWRQSSSRGVRYGNYGASNI